MGPRDEYFPDTEAVRQRFIYEELQPLRDTPWEIADRRLKGEYGKYTSNAATSSWRSREANRYVAELYRQRELHYVKRSIDLARYSVYVAVLLGLTAVIVAILAISLKDSVLTWISCRLFAELC